MSETKRKVLVVDDEDMIRDLTCDVIRSLGYEAVEASNGREAVAEFEKDAGGIGLVILDMSMPEMDGIQTFEALRAIDPAQKIVVSSGYSDDPSIKKLLKKGAIGILDKPFKYEELMALLHKNLG